MFSLRRTATASPAAPSAVSTTDVPLDGRDERVEPLVRAFTRLCQIRYLRLDRSDPCVVALLYFGKLNLGFHKFTVPSRQRNDGFGVFAEGVIVSVKSLVDPLNVRGKLRLLLKDELHSSLSRDRKSTRLNSSHGYISYAVFCLKKKHSTHRHRHQTRSGK